MTTSKATAKPAPLVLDEWMPGLTVADESANRRLSLLVYGPTGAGKTLLAASAGRDPRTSPVLILDAEGGTINVRSKNVYIKRIVTSDDLQDAIAKLAEGTLPFKTLVLDSFTDLSAKAMERILRTTQNSRRIAPDVEEGADWNIFNHRMLALTRFFRDLDCHLIATALEREESGHFFPAMLGKQVPQQVPGAFNTVGRLSMSVKTVPDGKGGTEQREMRTLQLQSSARYLAKDRMDPTGQLPAVMENPTVTKLMDRMEQGMQLALAAQEK